MVRREDVVVSDTTALEPLLRSWEVAQVFNVHTTTVREWARRGGLPFLQLPSGERRFRKSEAIAWYREQVAKHAAHPHTNRRGTKQRG